MRWQGSAGNTSYGLMATWTTSEASTGHKDGQINHQYHQKHDDTRIEASPTTKRVPQLLLLLCSRYECCDQQVVDLASKQKEILSEFYKSRFNRSWFSAIQEGSWSKGGCFYRRDDKLNRRPHETTQSRSVSRVDDNHTNTNHLFGAVCRLQGGVWLANGSGFRFTP